MARRTISTCDRCQKDYDDSAGSGGPFTADWSWGQKLGIQVFMLCGECTSALAAFLNLPNLAPKQDTKES
jgi:hypothetical protein